jgi:hypothetical protein
MSISQFTSSLSATLRWTAASSDSLATTTDTQLLTHTASKVYGTGSGQANIIWHDTLNSAATLSLSALPRSILGIAGNYSFSSVRTLRIKNAASSGNVTVTMAACGLSSLTLPPGGVIVIDSPPGWTASGTLAIGGTVTAVEVVLIGVGTGES